MNSNLIQSVVSSPWTLITAIFVLGISIFVHELGHFLAARRRGLFVERFSIGFGPKIFSWHGRDGVEYRLSWIPLGGYVLLPQLADLGSLEGKSTSDPSSLKPISYLTRMIVLVAGATFNVLFAIVLATILWVVGQPAVQNDPELSTIVETVPSVETSSGQVAPSPAYVAGLRSGDRVLTVDHVTVKSFKDIFELVVLGGGRTTDGNPQVALTYERAGQEYATTVRPLFVGREKIRDIGLTPSVPIEVAVALVQPKSAADEAGLKVKDTLVSVDGKPVTYTGFISDYIRQNPGKALSLVYARDGAQHTVSLTPRATVETPGAAPVYRLGIQMGGSFNMIVVHITPWTQIGDQLKSTWRTFSSLINPNSDIGLSKMSGAVGILNVVKNAAQDGIAAVILVTILINVNLAIFNLLPIPILDGGQMLFATIGKLRGRALPTNFIMAAQGISMVLILSMMVYITFFDVSRWARDARAEEPAAAQPEPGK